MVDPQIPYGWRHSKSRAGSGVIATSPPIASTGRGFLVGEIATVSAATRIFIDRRRRPEGGERPSTSRDAVEAVVEFAKRRRGHAGSQHVLPRTKEFFHVRNQRRRGLAGLEHGAPE